MAGVRHVDKHRFSQISLKLVRFPRALSVESQLKSPCTSLAMRRKKNRRVLCLLAPSPVRKLSSQGSCVETAAYIGPGDGTGKAITSGTCWRWRWKGNHEWYVRDVIKGLSVGWGKLRTQQRGADVTCTNLYHLERWNFTRERGFA